MSIGEIYGLLDFPILMIIGTTLVARYFPKRKYYFIKFILFSLLNIGVYILNRKCFSTFFFGILASSFVFIIAIITLIFTTKASIPSIFMATTIGYCIQNFSYCLMSSIRITIGLKETEQWYFLLLMLVPIFTLTYLFIYLFYLRNEKNRYHIEKINEKRQIFISVICIFGISILSSQAMKVSSQTGSTEFWYLTYGFNMIVCILTITGEFELLRSRSKAIENTRIKMMWENDKYSYQKSQENMQLINVKMHDLRHKLESLNNKISNEDIDELSNNLKFYATISETNCEVLDMILSEKYPSFIQNKVNFTCFVDAKKLNYIPKESLYSIFENAISNAYEAVMKLEEKKRVISITSKDYGDYLFVSVENYCPSNSNTTIGKTTKDNLGLHGYGLLSMKMMLDKYQGKMSILKNDDLFILNLIFPSKPIDHF